MSATPEQVLEWAEAYQGHDNAEGRGDNENCKWCDAWSDDDWRKPCPKSPRLMAAALIRAQAERVRVLEGALTEMLDAHSLENIGVDASLRRTDAKKRARAALKGEA